MFGLTIDILISKFNLYVSIICMYEVGRYLFNILTFKNESIGKKVSYVCRYTIIIYIPTALRRQRLGF